MSIAARKWETAWVARAVCPKGTVAMRLRETLSNGIRRNTLDLCLPWQGSQPPLPGDWLS
jgi:hypothetical protein